MNRKARFAYAYMIIGFVTFLVGLILLLNYDLSELRSSKNSSKQNSLNLTEFILMIMTNKINSDENNKKIIKLKNQINLNNLNEDFYLYWYCRLKTPSAANSINHNQDDALSSSSSSSSSFQSTSSMNKKTIPPPTTTTSTTGTKAFIHTIEPLTTTELITTTNPLNEFMLIVASPSTLTLTSSLDTSTSASTNNNNNNNNNNENDENQNSKTQELLNNLIENIENRSFYLRNFFSFIICSSEKIYLVIVIFSVLFGSVLLFYGCVRFYKYDIKINQIDENFSTEQYISTTANNISNNNTSNNININNINNNNSNSNNNNSDEKNLKNLKEISINDIGAYISKSSNDNVNKTGKNYLGINSLSKKNCCYFLSRMFIDQNTNDDFSAYGDEIKEKNVDSNTSLDKTNKPYVYYYNDRILDNKAKRISGESKEERAERAERTCPFIYEELPAFVVKNQSLIMEPTTKSSNHQIISKQTNSYLNSGSLLFTTIKQQQQPPPPAPPPVLPPPLNEASNSSLSSSLSSSSTTSSESSTTLPQPTLAILAHHPSLIKSQSQIQSSYPPPLPSSLPPSSLTSVKSIQSLPSSRSPPIIITKRIPIQTVIKTSESSHRIPHRVHQLTRPSYSFYSDLNHENSLISNNFPSQHVNLYENQFENSNLFVSTSFEGTSDLTQNNSLFNNTSAHLKNCSSKSNNVNNSINFSPIRNVNPNNQLLLKQTNNVNRFNNYLNNPTYRTKNFVNSNTNNSNSTNNNNNNLAKFNLNRSSFTEYFL